MMQDRLVLISGIGIAGSTLAYCLMEHGFRPTLVELTPRLRTGGYIIDFWGLGYDIAERMGLLPDLQRQGYDVEEVRFVDTGGRRVGGFGDDVFRKHIGGRYVSVPRGELASLVYRQIEGRCETIFDDGISGIERADDGARTGDRSSHFGSQSVRGSGDAWHSNQCIRQQERNAERFGINVGFPERAS